MILENTAKRLLFGTIINLVLIGNAFMDSRREEKNFRESHKISIIEYKQKTDLLQQKFQKESTYYSDSLLTKYRMDMQNLEETYRIK